jgi:hypothetical protein
MKQRDLKRLESVYFDPGNPAGYGGVQKLAKQSRLSPQEIKKWLKSQRTYTTHKPARKRYPTRRYVTRGLDSQWQADLVEMRPYADENQGNHYLLTVIDMFSRYAWAVPLQRKTPEEIIRAFSIIFQQDGRQPKYLQTDEGTEFENKKVRAFLTQRGIEQFSVKSQFKAAMVERFNRTLKTKMWRIFTHRGNYRWTDILPQLLEGYNSSIHRSIGRAPKDVTKEIEVNVWTEQYGNLKKPKATAKTKFQLEERVRVSKSKGLFEKGYKPNWSEEIFTINAINRKYRPIVYQLRDHRNRIIQGSFYEHELQSVDDTNQVYTIEKVLRTKGQGKNKQYLVKWLGYDETSWIKDSDFRQLT